MTYIILTATNKVSVSRKTTSFLFLLAEGIWEKIVLNIKKNCHLNNSIYLSQTLKNVPHKLWIKESNEIIVLSYHFSLNYPFKNIILLILKNVISLISDFLFRFCLSTLCSIVANFGTHLLGSNKSILIDNKCAACLFGTFRVQGKYVCMSIASKV